MFNVTILKMKDIVKITLGIMLAAIFIFLSSKNFKTSENSETNILEKLKTKIATLEQKSMLNCLEQTTPVISDVNDEYKTIFQEDNSKTNKSILQEILKTQISSLKIIEETKNSRARTRTKHKRC